MISKTRPAITSHFEPLAGLIRIFEEGKTYGDEYIWCATCRFIDIDKVEIMGVIEPLTPSIWRAIRAKFGEMNVSKIVFARKRDGKNELHEVNTTRKDNHASNVL